MSWVPGLPCEETTDKLYCFISSLYDISVIAWMSGQS
jgi:hypothetical protein